MKKIKNKFLELYNDRKQLLAVSFLFYIMYLIEDATPSNPDVVLATGWVAGAIVVGGLISTVGGNIASSGDRKRKRDEEARFDEMRETYEQSKFQALDREALRRENIFEGQENIFANQENIFADQENIMEDMEVDNEAADYAREQFSQQQANIMQGLRGVTGASGAAGLAQTLSGQASKQAKESQLTIGQQLQQNRRMRLQEQSRLNQQERTEQSRLNQQQLMEQSRMSQQVLMEDARLSEADRAVQLANMEGARQFELDKMTTLMGVSGQKIAGVNQQIAQTQQLYSQIGSTVSQAGAAWGGPSGTGK